MILNTKTIFCSNCFKNKQIKEYIAKYGRQAHKKYFCDFCKNESTEEGSIMDAEEFIPKLTTAIYNIYEYREGLWSESKYSYGDILDERAGYIKSTEEVFDELLDCKNNDKLFNTLRKNSPEFQEVEIDTPTWVSTCRYGIESGLEKWKDFCENVKYKARYFNHDSFSVTDTLEEFNRSFELLNMKDYSKKVFRARMVKSETVRKKIQASPKEELGKARPENVKNNRFSPIGISYGYFSFDVDTVLAEVRASKNEEVAIGRFDLGQDLKIIDFRSKSLDSKYKNLWSNDFSFILYCNAEFIDSFIKDISKPIDENDTLLEYVPTQIMAEYIWSLGYDGFVFDSSQKRSGENIVIFGTDPKYVNYEIRSGQKYCKAILKKLDNLYNSLKKYLKRI